MSRSNNLIVDVISEGEGRDVGVTRDTWGHGGGGGIRITIEIGIASPLRAVTNDNTCRTVG